MKLTGERLLMTLWFTLLPVALTLLLRPPLGRLEALRQRLRSAEAEAREFQLAIPLAQEERALLEAPDAPWRQRLPRVADDTARLAHLHRVVTDLSAALKARGVAPSAMRAIWDPVKADFTLPAPLARGPVPWRPVPGAPEDAMGAWVLEVDCPGPTADLFKALAALADVGPLLEPVGLRWEHPGGEGPRRQTLLLRNYYLKP